MTAETATFAPQAGCFIFGFDSILYNPQLRAANRRRFLAELFYGFIYDSKIVLAEQMVFDNVAMVRLLSKLRERKLNTLHQSIIYARHREPELTIAKLFLNPETVISALSSDIELARVQFLRSQASRDESWRHLANKLLTFLDHIPSVLDDDRLVLDNLRRGLRGDWPWAHALERNRTHPIVHRLRDWLEEDHRQNGNPLREKMEKSLEQPEVYPQGKAPNLSFDAYFAGRSLWHKTKAAWLSILGPAPFGRIDEYVNSAYMDAVRRTCQAASCVETPMSFANKDNVEAQKIMTASIPAGTPAFEFRLNIMEETDQHDESRPGTLEKIEDDLIEVLNSFYEDPAFKQAQARLNALDLMDPDYSARYIDYFGKLEGIANQAKGPFRLLHEGNRVMNVIPNVSECIRETEREEQFGGANGCEEKNVV